MATINPALPSSPALPPSNQRPTQRYARPRREARGGSNTLNERDGTTERGDNIPSQAAGEISLVSRPAPTPTPHQISVGSSGAEALTNRSEMLGPSIGRGRGRAGGGRGIRRGAGQNRSGRRENIEAEGNVNEERYRHTGHNHMPNVNNPNPRYGSGRQFGGRLTTTNEIDPSSSSVSTLQGDAPEFYPGQPHASRSHTSQKARIERPTRYKRGKEAPARGNTTLKSSAADVATRTHEDISNAAYECPICTSEVTGSSRVWSCKTCWTVFHLSCIKKWSTDEGSTLSQQRNVGDLPPPRQWRCPGCNLPKDILPSIYTCWCEKEADPKSISGIPPHSCGQTCGKLRLLPRKCPHPCELLCHAGPCSPCTHLGPLQSCFCGKKQDSRRCVDTNYDTGWSCGDICGELMPCGEHICPRPCHEGLCGACEVSIQCRCYCGKIEKSLICCERGTENQSQSLRHDESAEVVEDWIGLFSCDSKCERPFDCGRHFCKKPCHPQKIEASHCPLSPDTVSHCPCGKTLLAEISNKARKSCDDFIPNCAKQCLKELSCGHLCQQTCHADACLPCLEIVSISCRCGRVKSSTLCHQGTEETPQCMRTCKAVLNCGRHECGERCCSGERKATERQATKRKLRPLGASRLLDEEFEAEHICTRQCGRLLKCGNHQCPELCHKGPCRSCREAIFDEISCHCGKTILQPPSPCGTTPPPCRFECERVKSCDHPRIPHNCHGDEENCPKCPFLREKTCLCGKKNLKNQPCWLTDVRCGEVCRRKLRCGSHFCRKPCHRAGECEDVGKTCQQACGKAKNICGHPCEDLCHAPSSCKEDKPCQNKTLATCYCQHLKQEFKCYASKTSEGNSKKTLTCDDECARLERNRNLALALNIDPDAHVDGHIPYSNSTLNMFRESTKWGQAQEKEFRVFAADETAKRLRFKPMPPHQRAFIHSLSDDFGFDSESMDPEPHRHVAVFKTPKFVMAPMKTLTECIRIRGAAEASGVTTDEPRNTISSSNEPYNGFVMTNPRFGLTLEEIRADFSTTLDSFSDLTYDISFLPSEEIVIKARPARSAVNLPALSIEACIKALKAPLSTVTSSRSLATSIKLCTLDASLNVLRREMDDLANGGWSQVAAKAAAPRLAPRQLAIGEKSMYTVLGSKLRDVKKKTESLQRAKEEAVIDDWEEEVRREEAAK